MSDLRTHLERERQRFTLPPDAFERLSRRRTRKRRNQRVATALVALILAALAIGGAILTFAERAEQKRPATVPITPSNVADLRPAWTAILDAKIATIAAGNGHLIVVTHRDRPTPQARVYAFTTDCQAAGTGCLPLWTADVGDAGNTPDGPSIVGDTVYVAGQRLYAFPLDCRTDGGSCAPSWIGRTGSVADQPVVAGDSVFVATTGGRVYAFPVDCGTGSAPCAPRWVSRPLGLPLLASAVVGNDLYVSVVAAEHTPHLNRIFAFRTDCASPCRPESTWDIAGQAFVSMPVIEHGIAYVGTAVDGTNGTLRAYDATCGFGTRCLLWQEPVTSALNIPKPVVADGRVYVAARFGSQFVRAYPVGLAPPGDPVWTACCTPEITDSTPAVSGGLVFVASHLMGISAYPERCRPMGLVCLPAWTWGAPDVTRPGGPSGHAVEQVALSDGRLFAAVDGDVVYAFATVEPSDRGGGGEPPLLVAFSAMAAVLTIVLLGRRRARSLGGVTEPAEPSPDGP